ncbi:MAG: hypothetical protein AB7I50_01680 [Vicinamibacterales bacterium]
MAHLWIDQGSSWVVLPLASDVVRLDADARYLPESAGCALAAALIRTRGEPGDAWLLYSPRHVLPRPRVNGTPLLLEIRVLADRDEIALGAASWFFSTELLPAIAPFDGLDPVICPRCKTAIAPGELAVQCPGCRTRFHEHDDMTCFTYGNCPLCGRQTNLAQSYSWTPEAL